MRFAQTLLAAAMLATAALPAAAQTPATVVDIAAGSRDHSTLGAAVQAAGLVDTLKGSGPFTVFAPTNAAFGKLPAGTVDNLLKPENKGTLTSVLTYHVVPGRLMAADVARAIQSGGGSATVTTVQGGRLTARVENGAVVLTDAKGGKARVTATDLSAGNGVVHVIDTVVMP